MAQQHEIIEMTSFSEPEGKETWNNTFLEENYS